MRLQDSYARLLMVTMNFTYNHKILYPNLFRVGVLNVTRFQWSQKYTLAQEIRLTSPDCFLLLLKSGWDLGK